MEMRKFKEYVGIAEEVGNVFGIDDKCNFSHSIIRGIKLSPSNKIYVKSNHDGMEIFIKSIEITTHSQRYSLRINFEIATKNGNYELIKLEEFDSVTNLSFERTSAEISAMAYDAFGGNLCSQ